MRVMTLFLIIAISLALSIGCGGKSPGASSTSSNTSDSTANINYRIFVTSSTHQGDFGSNTAADTICSNLATAAGLTRTYKAIISDNAEDAINRINTTLTGAIVMVRANGSEIEVAPSMTDFFAGSGVVLTHSIDTDEGGATVAAGGVFTGTQSNGTKRPNENCANWTDLTVEGNVGNSGLTDGGWVNYDEDDCNNLWRLYCISQ